MVETKFCKSCETHQTLTTFSVCLALKDGLQHYCKACMAKRGLAWRRANPDRCKALHDRWNARNPEKRQAIKRASYLSARRRDTEADRARALRWIKDNPARSNAANASKRAAKLKATPAWANQFFIEEIYDIARVRSLVTGFKWHVDHAVPLQSLLVCGLHVEHNLTVIPAIKNISKGNRHWPDMPT